MQYLPIVYMFNCEAHLHEPVKNLILRVHNLAYLLLISNLCVQISTICIVHDNAQTFLVHEGFFVSDDIRVAHGF